MDEKDRKKIEAQKMLQQEGRRRNIWTILLVILGAWLVWSLLLNPGPPGITYDMFKAQLEKGQVTKVEVRGDRIRGELKEPIEREVDTLFGSDTVEHSSFTTYVPSFGDDELMRLLEQNDVEFKTEPKTEGGWLTALLLLSPLLLFIGLGYLQYKRMSGGGAGQSLFSIGKSRAKQYDKSRERTTFDDVAGAESAKQELQEIVAYLKDPERIERLGGEVPNGVLLVGAPGTGKTLLARAVAGEADVPFFTMTGSDFMEMFVGVGASRVRNLFEDAKKDAPSIIFIDELDSIGRQRGAGLGGGHDEREQTLNQLLSEMDGFEPNENVIVMSATNRPDILDPALQRPGRFDRRIIVDLPSTKDRLAILQIHAERKPLGDDVDLERLARSTPGFSGADLENLLNEAALLAARSERETILEEDIQAARDKILMGLERQGLALTDDEKRLVAYHEGGHAITAALLPHADPVHKVSIIPRTRSMGMTQQLPERETYIYRREYMLDRLAVMMGGRAAEQIVFDTSTSGAANDLVEASKLARKMVLDWGMSKKFRHMALGGQREQVFLGEEIAGRREYSEATAREVDEEVQSILAHAFERSEEVITEHRDEIDRLAEELIDEEEIPGERVLELLGRDPQELEGSTDDDES